MTDDEYVVHPLTGEIVADADVPGLLELVEAYLRGQRAHYAFRDVLRRRAAELRGKPVLPRPRYRTDKQARIGCCPSCGRDASGTETAG